MNDSRDLREEFRPTAEQYRRVSWFLMIPWVISVAFFFLLSSPKYKGYGFAGIALCVGAPVIGSLMWLPKLICPGCQKRLDERSYILGQSGLGKFCPECGEAALKDGWFYPKCTACGKSLSRGRGGRQFKIRFCTWCDARLDDKGV
jgi:hypothetical protein